MKSRKSAAPVIIIIIFILAFAAFAFLTVRKSLENAALEEQLAASRMDAAIRTEAEEIRTAIAENEQTEYEAMLAERETLQSNMMATDEAELLMVVNPWNPVPEGYNPRAVDIGDEKEIDERAAGALAQMVNDCIAAGWAPVPLSGYRTHEYQQGLFDDKVQRVIMSGTSADQAEDKAAEEVAKPGTSEHELGLAMDIIDEYYTELDVVQEWTSTQKWLIEHCSEYGFILRYPNGTSDITGIIYEPWHYRYVGKKAAAEITELGVTLEEYVELKG